MPGFVRFDVTDEACLAQLLFQGRVCDALQLLPATKRRDDYSSLLKTLLSSLVALCMARRWGSPVAEAHVN
eukprot:scaffold255783_cov31-Prasinocladus_malaysianus.AAC.1